VVVPVLVTSKIVPTRYPRLLESGSITDHIASIDPILILHSPASIQHCCLCTKPVRVVANVVLQRSLLPQLGRYPTTADPKASTINAGRLQTP